MKKLLVLVFIILSLTSVYADYWETYDQDSPIQIERNYLDEAIAISQTKKGLDKTIYETFSPTFASVRALFTSFNNFLGEFIFLTRLILWFSFIIILQIVVVKVFTFILKTGLMISTIISFIANSDDIIDAYQNKIGVPLKLRKKEGLKKFHKSLFILKEIIKTIK